jgi:hypothetical protein
MLTFAIYYSVVVEIEIWISVYFGVSDSLVTYVIHT